MYRARRRPDSGAPRMATFFPSYQGRVERGAIGHMFSEDVRLAVLPIGRDDQSKLDIELTGDSDHVDQATALLESIATHQRYDINELVCDAIETIVQHLSWNGIFVAEIIRDEEATLLHDFTPERLFRVPGFFVQLVPREDWEFCGKSVVFVPKDDIWKVTIPRSLGGRRSYKRLRRSLDRFESVGPEFWRDSLRIGTGQPSFDFQEYTRDVDTYHALATGDWGWNKRDYSQKNWTEFYGLYRSLLFKHAQAQLREHCFGELNGLFGRLGLVTALSVSGLPSADDILRIRSELVDGEISFAAAYEACRV